MKRLLLICFDIGRFDRGYRAHLVGAARASA